MSDVNDWYFDVISPFAYLQWMRLRRDHPQLQLRPPTAFASEFAAVAALPVGIERKRS
jgi:2-hydroxychromene-2-carboxylate isomerase